MADVTKLLEKDHREAERLLETLKVAAVSARSALIDQLGAALTLHMHLEESIVYPAIAKWVDGGDDMVKEARAEHAEALKALAELERVSPNGPGFDGALAMLAAGISHHVEDEEDELFPQVRASVRAADLEQLGELVAAAKAAAN